jgi:hypothetical protein
MNYPSMTIETVHGLKETIIFNNFIVGPSSPKMEEDGDREVRDRKESPSRIEKQR